MARGCRNFKAGAGPLRGGLATRRLERCRNPWNGRCRKTDIAVYIVYKGKALPVCRGCWADLAENPVEWGEPSGVRRG